MRLSSIKTSPYYSGPLVQRAVVYLNGIVVSPVVEFDEENGWVILVSVGDRGEVWKHPESPVGVKCRRYRGTVEATFRTPTDIGSAPLIHPRWLVEDAPPSSPSDSADAKPDNA